MSRVTVHVPAPLRELTGGRARFAVEASTVDEMFTGIRTAEPLLAGRIFDDEGTVRGFVNLFLDGRDVRRLEPESRGIVSDAELSVVPSVAGG
jgi:molybdopterin synthase sulfur carrier subunit